MALVLEITTYLVALFWLLVLADRRRAWPAPSRSRRADSPTDRPATGAPPADATPVRVRAVVPARNEAETIGACLRSLLLQEATAGGRPVDLEVCLVDDRSGDGTTAVARSAAEEVRGSRGATTPRLLVVRTEPPPAGWAGKVHAMATGVAAPSDRPAEWLLFSDADIAHHPASLASLLTRALDTDRDLVSIMARLRADSFWERLLVPAFVYFFQLLYPFRLVGDDRSPTAAAAGGCMLVRAAALDRAGGLESIRHALIDDVALAQSVAAAGGRLWLGLDPDVVSLRPYPRLGDLWRMVSRSAYVQLRYRVDWLLLTLAGLAIFFCSPPLAGALAAVAVAAWAAPPPVCGSWWVVLATSLVTWSLQAWTLLPSVRHHGVPRAYAATLPLAGFFYALMTWSSAWNHWRGRGTRWKGRVYTGEAS